MEIIYIDEESFYKGVAECVKYGLTFEAMRDTLIIHLTGGC
jgi:hypothetical protein